MASKPILQVAEFVSSADGSHKKDPFFIVETNLTVDGPRTRICTGRWATFLVAEAHRKQLEREGKA